MKKILLTCFIVLSGFFFLSNLSSNEILAAQKVKYETWQAVAKDMNVEFQSAIKAIDGGDTDRAYAHMNKAYFGYYEVQGFEKNVMVYISSKRVSEIEGSFRKIKHTLRGNINGNVDELDSQINLLAVKVYKDAMVLDGVASIDDPDSVGKLVFGDKISKIDEASVKTRSFLTSFGLLLREGLEAILVVVAIIAYLVKTNNQRLIKKVYAGVGFGVLASLILAVLIEFIFGGVGQELMEGLTMFLAVAVLFWVSNWILSRSHEEAWEEYIHSQVEKSIDNNSGKALIFSAFLAVAREGAELVLFYKAMLTGGQTNITYAVYGFLLGCVVLIAIYLIFRYTTVKLPLRPFFLFTSILLFILCVSFMGKGVVELTEAGIISGGTVIPAMNGYQNEWLNIYDRAETLIPQIMLIIAAIWILIANRSKNKKENN